MKISSAQMLAKARLNEWSLINKYVFGMGDLNAQDADGFTLVMYAVLFRHDAIVAMLAGNKANLSLTTSRGNDALRIAIRLKYMFAIGVIVECFEGSPMIEAICMGATTLPLTGANRRCNRGFSPLYYAMEYNGNVDMIQKVYDRGAKPEEYVNCHIPYVTAFDFATSKQRHIFDKHPLSNLFTIFPSDAQFHKGRTLVL